MGAIRVQLFGGEKDGDVLALDIEERPDLIYACRAGDDSKVWNAKGKARGDLVDKLGVLAYAFRECVETEHGPEYRYDRKPERDKQPQQ